MSIIVGEVLAAVGILLLGWILGLLSPQIVDRIQRGYRRKEFQQTLALELEELRLKLVLILFDIRKFEKTFDPEFVKWVKQRLDGYSGVITVHQISHVIELLNLPWKELERINAMPQDPKEDTLYQRYTTPFLSSQLGNLVILPLNVQNRLLEILVRLEMFNWYVDHIVNLHQQTFDSTLSPGNREAIDNNIQTARRSLATVSRLIVDYIDAIILAF